MKKKKEVHICVFRIIRGSGKRSGTSNWKCECGKRVKSS